MKVTVDVPIHFATAPWMVPALCEIGEAEIAGAKHNERILEYHAHTLLRATTDEIPWCAAYACWALAKGGVMSTHSAKARDFLSWGMSVMRSDRFGLNLFPYGTVLVFSDDARGPDSGHVGFYVGNASSSLLRVLGGNQGNAVQTAKYELSKLLDARWPTEKELKTA